MRIEPASISLPLDRDRIAGAARTILDRMCRSICLDTETTGLATGAGTVAFLVGLGWWVGDQFHQVQLLLPDQAGEPGMLDAPRRPAAVRPAGSSRTTAGASTGRCWSPASGSIAGRRRSLAGHLDLLPFVRRVFRHRLTDARLKTVETELLGERRGHDIEGWEIPGRYLEMLRGGPVEPIAEVVRHNHEDVRSLARLMAHADRHLGAIGDRRSAPRG